MSDSCSAAAAVNPPAKRLRSHLGLIHDKRKCIWSCKGESAKNPDAKLSLLSYDYARREDESMRERINFHALMLLAFTTRRMVRSAHLALSPIRFTAQFDFAASDR